MTVSAAKVAEGFGGNKPLKNMDLKAAIALVESYHTLENQINGVEPVLTEFSVRASLKFFTDRQSLKKNQSNPNWTPLGRGGSQARKMRPGPYSRGRPSNV